MALNSIGMLENAPGANRLESAVLYRSMAQTGFDAAATNKQLYTRSTVAHRAFLISLVGLKNLNASGFGKSASSMRDKQRELTKQAQAMDAERQRFGQDSIKHFQDAVQAKKKARRDHAIGTIQKFVGRVFRVNNTANYPILNR